MKDLINNKLIAFIAIVFLSLTTIMFSACDPNGIFFSKDELKENVVKVELINYDNPESKTVKDTNLILPFDFEKMQVIEVLPESQFDDFIVDLSNVEIFHYREYKEFSDSAKGICLKVNYNNGDFILLSSNYDEERHYSCIVAIFDNEGAVKEPIGRFSWRPQFVDLINKYFETAID